VAADDRAGATRGAVGIPVHASPRFGLCAWADKRWRGFPRRGSGAIVLAQLNEPHALTAAWLAGLHRPHSAAVVVAAKSAFRCKRIGVASEVPSRGTLRANSEMWPKSLVKSGIARERFSVVMRGQHSGAAQFGRRVRERGNVGASATLNSYLAALCVCRGKKGRGILQKLSRCCRPKIYSQARLIWRHGACRRNWNL